MTDSTYAFVLVRDRTGPSTSTSCQQHLRLILQHSASSLAVDVEPIKVEASIRIVSISTTALNAVARRLVTSVQIGLIDFNSSFDIPCSTSKRSTARLGLTIRFSATLGTLMTAVIPAVSVATGRFPINTLPFRIGSCRTYQIFEFLLF